MRFLNFGKKFRFSRLWVKALRVRLKKGLHTNDFILRILLLLPPIAVFVFLVFQYRFVNSEVPLWQTLPWGSSMLASKRFLWLFPVAMLVLNSGSIVLWYLAKKTYLKYLSEMLLMVGLGVSVALGFAVFRICVTSSTQLAPYFYVGSEALALFLLFLFSFIVSFFAAPKFIARAYKANLITDPKRHNHPGMVLGHASARGAGFFFSLCLLVMGLLFTDRNPQILGICLGAFVAGFIGLLDDLQNTNPFSKFKFLENPFLRLVIFVPIPVFIMMYFGITAGYINNPFDGDFVLSDYPIKVGGLVLNLLPYFFTLLWTMWVMNLISWSNGVDGQFSGVAGLACLIVGILAMRLVQTEPAQLQTAKVAFIASGLAFGLIPYTWHPSKIMWGFGAISVGFILSALSIEARTKIAVLIMVILIPFFDGAVTFIRRILQGKMPFRGDRGHLHHLLLKRGWSTQKVALFYWITAGFFGIIALLTSEKSNAFLFLSMSGIVVTFIVVVNILSRDKA